MARRGKNELGRKIEVIKHNNGTSAVLYFNQRSMDFTVTIGADTKVSKDGTEVRRWAMAMLGKSVALTWVPVVDIDINERTSYYRGEDAKAKVSVEFEVDRFWLAETPGGRLLQLSWAEGDEDSTGYLTTQDERLQHADSFRFDGRSSFSHRYRDEEELPKETIKLPRNNGDHRYLAYTPELWAGLTAIIGQVKTIKKTLQHMVGTKAGITEIERVGRERVPLRLTAGE